MDWLDSYSASLYGQRGEPEQRTADEMRFWWRLFNDTSLNELIDEVRRKNRSLRIAGLRILESRAQLGIAASSLYPQLQQLGGAVNYVDTRQRGGGLPADSQRFFSYQVGFNLGWELDFWGRFKRGIESADAAYFNSVANQQDAQVLLTAQVADLYYTYRTTQLRIEIARKNAEIQKRSYDITRQVYESGEESELDLQQAKTQYLSTLAAIPDLESSLVKTRNALCTLLARPPGDIAQLAGEVKALPKARPQVIGDMPTQLLIRRPDIRAAAWQVAVQSAQIGIAEADFYPSVSLLGTLGWSGNSLANSPDTGGLTLGPGFAWNIFDYGRIENNVRVQDARLQQLIESYQETVLQAVREIDNAAVSVVKTLEGQGILTQAVESSQRALELANTRYREGYADFQRVLDAQRALFSQAERDLLNQGSHVSAVIALYKALGGGWQPMSMQQMIPGRVRDSMGQRTDWGPLLNEAVPLIDSKPTSTAGGSQHE